MIVDTLPVRRSGKKANQVKFGKQSNGTQFPVAMSPTKSAAIGDLWNQGLRFEMDFNAGDKMERG